MTFAGWRDRRVVRALLGYGVFAFAVLQIIEPIMHGLHWPESVLTAVVIALAAGGPAVVAVAWVLDVGADGRRSRAGLALVGASVLVAGGFLTLSLRKVRASLGSVEFRNLPAGAQIDIEGASHAGDKPIYLREGDHEFNILAPGYETRTGKVFITRNISLSFDLALKPLNGRLTVIASETVTCTIVAPGSPPRTEIVKPDAPLKIEQPAATLQLKCVKPGTEAAFERTVQLAPGQYAYVEVSFRG